MSQLRMPYVQTRRDAWVEVNLANIEHNIKAIKKMVSPETKMMAVIKADAYGHGSPMVAPTLAASGINMFGVASVDEGIQLRESGIDAPILVLGVAPSWSYVAAIENDLQLSVFSDEHVKACISAYNKLNKKAKVHVKVDTGMHRIGISHEKAVNFINEVAKTESIKLEGVFTHLACAETPKITEVQKTAFESVTNNLSLKNILIHAVSTAGMMSYPDMHYDMVRAGIGIYGLYPDLPQSHSRSQKAQLKQAMGLKGRIVYLKNLPADSGISYGYSFTTNNSCTKIATVPIGYADGVSRALSNKIYGLINGKRIRQVGNITMDQMMFDVSDIENINEGDIITLLGKDGDDFIPIELWSNCLNTINYEITCKLRVRLPRVYTR